MTTQLESTLGAFNPTCTLNHLNEAPLLKELARGYQLDMQSTQSLEHLISQEKFQPDGLHHYEPENAGEWSFRDKVHKVIKELVTVKNHYFNILTQALALIQKQEQRINAKSVFIELHNLMNSHKDLQIRTLKDIIGTLGFDPESRALPTAAIQSTADPIVREEIIQKIQDCNRLELPKRELIRTEPDRDKQTPHHSKSKSTHKRNTSLFKDVTSQRQAPNTARKVQTTTNIRSRENSIEQRRDSDPKKNIVLSQELLNITQRYKGTPGSAQPVRRTLTEKKTMGQAATPSTSCSQDLKKILFDKKTSKSPVNNKQTGSVQRSQLVQSKKDVLENLMETLKTESTELPRGVKLISKNRENASRLNTRRSTENHNIDYPCQEKLLSSQRSASLSRSPDSTPNMTPQTSRIHTAEELAMLNRKDIIDVYALQKGLKKSCKKLMRKKDSHAYCDLPLQPRNPKTDYLSHKETLSLPKKEEEPRQRRSKSIGSAPSGLSGQEFYMKSMKCVKSQLEEQGLKDSPIKEKTYNSQSSIAGSLLHDINSISIYNQTETATMIKDQENIGREQSIPVSKKQLAQIFGLRDVNKTLSSRENLAGKDASGYYGQVHTERSARKNEGDSYEVFKRRKSVGRRESNDPVKLEVMYGTKTLKKVKNWAPLLQKKNY